MWLLKLALLPAFLGLVSSDFPLDIDYTNVEVVRNTESLEYYRLSEDIYPNHYDIEIYPHFETTDLGEAFTINGTVMIDVTVATPDMRIITIHENVREIFGVSIIDSTGVAVELDPWNPFERVPQYHFLRIFLREGLTLTVGENYQIRVVYLAYMNETPLTRGVFRGRYRDNTGNTRWYAATHFQPTNARQAFPGFDEPGFKSTFDLSINRPITFGESYSNMPIAAMGTSPDSPIMKEVFYRTPRMSTYLLTFHISEEFEPIADNLDNERPYRILARPNAAGQGDYALEVGVELTKWLEDFFDIPYYTMAPFLKNDQIASPDWASGATENWGLVSYRELRLLYDENEMNLIDQQSILTITAHELAHKWFGNLITCKWWDNIWINEGFASYFEYFAAHEVRPDYSLDEQFNVMYKQMSMSSDSSLNTPPLNRPDVNTPDQVTAHFGTITYAKGASILNMLKMMLTPNTFKKALNLFLRDRSYEYAEPQHLYDAFSRAVSEDGVLDDFPLVDIADFFQSWIDQAGYPVLNVDVDMERGVMSLTQERFFLSASANPADQLWPLPLTFTTGSNPDFTQLRPTDYMIGTSSLVINKEPGHEWVIFNIGQTGHYRVNYDEHNWELLADQLQSDFEVIHHLNRAQIVDDVFALMRSTRLSFEVGFKVLSYLPQETSYYVWYPAITGFNWLRNRLLHLPVQLAQFDEFLLETFDNIITDLGYADLANESRITKMNRFYIMAFACSIGHEGCVADALAQFQAGTPIHPNLRRHVYCEGVREGGASAYNRLLTLRRASNVQADEVVLLRALGCTSEEATINQYLEMILSDEVRAQDRVNAFTFLFMGNRANSRQALQFIKARHNDIREAVVGSSRFSTVLSNLASYLDEEGLQDMEEWLNAEQNSLPEFAGAVGAVAGARSNMAWGEQNADNILRGTRGAAVSITAGFILPLAASALLALYRY